jgi:hypothetical protein
VEFIREGTFVTSGKELSPIAEKIIRREIIKRMKRRKKCGKSDTVRKEKYSSFLGFSGLYYRTHTNTHIHTHTHTHIYIRTAHRV